MAILAIMHGQGLSKELYESLRAPVAWETNHPAGITLHAAGFDENGDMHVVDVWDSAEQMEQFFVQRLLPVLQEKNVTPPQVSIFPLHNLNCYPGTGKYSV